MIQPDRTPSIPWMLRVRRALDSLHLRITLSAVGVLLLGIGLTTAVLVRQAERDTVAASRQRELGEAVHMAARLSQRAVDLQRALQAVAVRLDPQTFADDNRLESFIADKPVLRGLFASVFVYARDGRMRLLADRNGISRPAINAGDRPYFQRTLAEHRAIVSEPVPSRLTGQPIIVFTYPLMAAGTVYGVLSGSLQLTSRDLLDDMFDGVESDGSALVVLTDMNGQVLAHPNRALVTESIAAEPRFAQAFADWRGSGSAVEPAGLRLAQAGDVVSAAGVAGPDWIVWRALPEAELLAPLRVARRQALAWAGGFIVVLSGAMLTWLWWLLQPLTRLEHRAQHLFDGTQDAQAGWPTSGGEIGRLARVLRHVGAERAQLESFNTQVLQKLGSVMSSAPVGIAFTRAQRFELVSTEFCRLFGRTEQALLGQPTQIIYASNADFQAVGPQVVQAFSEGRPYVGEWEMLHADGRLFWARLRARPVDEHDSQAGTIWTVDDISEQIAARTQLEWSATHDVLTGLFNRKALDTRMARVFEVMPRSLPAAIVMIDLDHFKPINDGAGHAAGDAMLKLVAAAILSCVRTSDLVVRQGGDEFVLLLERCDSDVALRVANNVRQAVAAIRLPWEHRLLTVGASVGVASLAAEMRDATSWLAAADAACYLAKSEGRNGVRVAVRPMLIAKGDGTVLDEES